MIICLQEIIALLPIIVLCITTFFVLLLFLIHRNHRVTFFITMFGFSLSFVSLYLVWKNGAQRVTDLICIDGFSLLCMMLVLITGFLITIICRMVFDNCSSGGNYDEFYLLLLIVNIGSMVVVSANHLVMLFFGIELVSLPLFGLMGYCNVGKHSLEATIKYVLLSGVSTSFLLFGISLIYVETTHLSFFDIYFELVNRSYLNQSKVLIAGVAMILFGLGFKLSLVPFHLWTADVYQGVSEISGMCLATISKISIFSALTRFFLLFPESYCNKISYVLVLISCFSILFGNVMATRQNNIKRVVAYSSVAYMGYLLVAIIASMKDFSKGGSHYVLSLFTNGIETISFSLVNYLFSVLGIFSVLCLLSSHSYIKEDNKESEDIGRISLYRGLFWKHPMLSIIFTVITLSLAGVPVTLGFISKFYLINLSVGNGLLYCTGAIILGTVISMLYYLRIITILYLSPLFKNVRLSDVIFLDKINYSLSSIITTLRVYYYQEGYVSKLFGLVVLLVISSFLLFLGMFPQFLVNLFFLIQKNF